MGAAGVAMSPDQNNASSKRPSMLRCRRAGSQRAEGSEAASDVATAECIDPNGMRLRDVPTAWLGAVQQRYMWLDLELDDGEPLRALGEVLPSTAAMGQALDIRFKHLFPDHRRRLMQALASERSV